MRISRTILFVVFLFTVQVFAQSYGQNKVQYEDFKWHYIQSKHFDVYFYPGAYEIATFVANEAETSYVDLKADFKYQITKRIKIILYKSHNHFQQTNVIDSYMPEGVGGVTELYKNRVVIPFEGSYSQLRHVLHHELVHAVMNDMLYGGSVQSLVSGQVVPVPTWFAEGLAEYFSMRWDTRADMILRDATMTGYLPPIEYLSYYMAYQGGQSLFRYIAQKYGHEKIGEILHKVKGSFRIEAAFKSALGIELKELSEEWHKQMRKEYWPDITNRDEPGDIARAVTDHKKTENYLNIAPALSPNGDKMVFLSNMDDKQSIYLMDILENKIVKRLIRGETSIDFEELHWLSPGMGWSPDGKKVTFTAKAGDQDALYIYDIVKDDIEQFKFDLDGLFSASWSPVSDEIAFIGNIDGASDVYIFDLKTKDIKNLTNDRFADSYPDWSADGKSLVFVSERGKYITPSLIPADFQMAKHNYDNTDIYQVDIASGQVEQLTDTPDARESDPVVSSDGRYLFYSCDASGVYNIYKKDLESGESFAITNLLTGAFQLSLDNSDKTLAFASFNEGGWDIFTIKDPLSLPEVHPDSTVYLKSELEPFASKNTAKHNVEADTARNVVNTNARGTSYRNYVFADINRRTVTKKVDVKLDQESYKMEDGHYKVRNYKVKFSPDIVYGAAGYSTLWGFQGYTSLAFSDVLGNHKINIGTNLVFDLKNSHLLLQYMYLPKRIDYGFVGYHYANTLRLGYYNYVRYRRFGGSAIASRPFNKFSRIDFSLNYMGISMENLTRLDTTYYPDEYNHAVIPGIQFVFDNSEWRWPGSGPYMGFRGLVALSVSPRFSNNSPGFVTLKTDLRKYFRLSDMYSIAMRVAAGASRGSDPQTFFLGGVDYWINSRYSSRDTHFQDLKDVYFSEFISPLRGASYYRMPGDNFAITNFEFRFPLIPYMQLGFPPIALGNVIGLFFVDAGTAFYSKESNHFKLSEDGKLKDVIASYGVGTRMYMFGMMIKYDVAWMYDMQNSSKPRHLWSIGLDF